MPHTPCPTYAIGSGRLAGISSGSCAWLAGLQISDASSFSDYIPTDSHPAATAHVTPTASTEPQSQTQHLLLSTPQAVSLPGTTAVSDNAGQQASASRQPLVFNRQDAPASGQKAPYSGQKGCVSGHLAPGSSGQKSQVSGQSLLNTARAGQHSKQATLDGQLKRALNTGSYSSESVERPSKSVRRLSQSVDGQISATNGQDLAPSLAGSTARRTDSALYKDRSQSRLSPYGNVAQVLDLTQEQEDDASTLTTSRSKSRHAVWPLPEATHAPEDLVDLT